jgi:hypothetical protein
MSKKRKYVVFSVRPNGDRINLYNTNNLTKYIKDIKCKGCGKLKDRAYDNWPFEYGIICFPTTEEAIKDITSRVFMGAPNLELWEVEVNKIAKEMPKLNITAKMELVDKVNLIKQIPLNLERHGV